MAEGSQPATRALLVVVAIATAWSAIRPADWGTWFFELFLGAAGIAVLLAVSRRYRFSWLIYAVAAGHYVILAVGAKYTYAGEPFFSWLRDLGLFSRASAVGDEFGHYPRADHPDRPMGHAA
jgi:putative membrane protein